MYIKHGKKGLYRSKRFKKKKDDFSFHNPLSFGKTGYNLHRKELDRLKSSYKILEDTIQTCDPVLLKKISDSYEGDIDQLFDEIIDQVYIILYGNEEYIKPNIRFYNEINSQLNETMRLNDLGYFCSDVIEMQISKHHVEWSWVVGNFYLICILASRDHGKSYFFSHGYPLWQMYRYDKNSLDQNFLNGQNGYIFSASLPQAADHLEILKDTIELNDNLRERLYPKKKENWSKVSIKTKNGCRLRVKGYGSSTRGAHPHYIVCDDSLSDASLYSKLKRDRAKDYFNSVIFNMLTPGGQMVVVGTPFHEDDLYQLLRGNPDWVFRVYPAFDKKGNPLWPERHSKKDLVMRKRLMGNIIFSREFLCKPITDDMAIFTKKMLNNSIRGMGNFSYLKNIEESKTKYKYVITGADFSISANAGADYTAFITIGIDEWGGVWILNIFKQKGIKYKKQKSVLKSIYRRFRPNLMILENNQFQAIYSQELIAETDMPIVPYTTTSRKNDMLTGVPGMALLFQNGKFHFPYATLNDQNVTKIVHEELATIAYTEKGVKSVGAHDDITMALWLAIQGKLMVESGGTKGITKFDFLNDVEQTSVLDEFEEYFIHNNISDMGINSFTRNG